MVHNTVMSDSHTLSVQQLEAIKKTVEALESNQDDVTRSVKRLLRGLVDMMDSDVRHIVRSFDLPEAYVQVGVSLLHYTSRLLHFTMPDEAFKVAVTQNGDQLRMVLEVSADKKDDVESIITKYADILLGEKPLNTLLENKVQLMEWKQKLDLSALELRITRDLYNNTDGLLTEDITALERDVKELHHLVGGGLKGSFALEKIVNQQNSEGPVKDALVLLQQKLTSKITDEDEMTVKNALSTIAQYEPAIFSEISEVVHNGSLPGKAENYLASWIASLSGILPR